MDVDEDSVEMSIEQYLNDRNADIKSLLENWWSFFLDDRDAAISRLIMLMFHAAGWEDFHCHLRTFPTPELIQQLKEEGSVSLYPLVLNIKCPFFFNYSEFIIRLTQFNHCQLIHDEQFLRKFKDAINILQNAHWDSFRVMAVLTGMKLMTSLHYECETLREELSMNSSSNISTSTSSEEAGERSRILFKIQTVSKVEQELLKNMIEVSIRDRSNEVRLICVTELLLWAKKFPTSVLRTKLGRYIVRSMLDFNSSVSETSYLVVFHLLKKQYDLERQKELFQLAKSNLILGLGMNSQAEISMKIFSSVIEFLDVELTPSNLESIYFCIFSPRRVLATIAGNFVYRKHFHAVATSPSAMLNDLLLFYTESEVKSEDLLIDAIYENLKRILNWEDWFNFIVSSPPEQTLNILSLFCAFVRKAITGYVPDIRKESAGYKMSKIELAMNQKEFTAHFSVTWFVLIEEKNIKLQPRGLIKMIKVAEFFSSDVPTNVMGNLTKVITGTMTTSNYHGMIILCSEVLSKLWLKCNSPEKRNKFRSIMDPSIKLMIDDFLDFMRLPLPSYPSPESVEFRLLALSKYHDIDYKTVWETCQRKLINSTIVCMMNELINVILSIQFQILMNYTSKAIEKANDESENASNREEFTTLILACTYMSSDLYKEAKKFLMTASSPLNRKLAFFIMADLLEYFGPHLSSHPKLFSLDLLNFEEDVLQGMINYTVEVIEHLKKNESSETSQFNVDEGYSVVSKMCNLLSHGFFDILYISDLIKLLQKTSCHKDILISCIKTYMVDCSKNWKRLSIAIFNGLLDTLRDDLKNGRTIEESVKGLQEILESLLDTTKIKREVMRKVVLELHVLLLDYGFRPRSCSQLLILLHSLRLRVIEKDVDYLITCMEQYKSPELTQYMTLLEQSLRPIRSQRKTVIAEQSSGDTSGYTS